MSDLRAPFHNFGSWTQKWKIYIDLLWGFLQYEVQYSHLKSAFSIKNIEIPFSNGPQLMGKRFMANLHASLDSTCKSRISKMSMRCQSCRGPFHNFGSWNSDIYRFTLISFIGFPAMLSAIQPSQMCIFNKKYSKLTFSNGPQLMRKSFMANLHASLDSTFKSRISKMSMRCQSCRGPFHNFGSWTQKWKIYIDIFYGVSCNVRCNTAISNVHFQ